MRVRTVRQGLDLRISKVPVELTRVAALERRFDNPNTKILILILIQSSHTDADDTAAITDPPR